MTKIAALFPGQGSQYVGMGQDLCDSWTEAAEVFAEADKALGSSISQLCFAGSEDDLRLTENTQPALLTHSVAAWKVLERKGLTVDAVAGHSLGEYSAAVVAGALSLTDAARTVRLRGQLMQQAVPLGEGAMVAVLGLNDEDVNDACNAATKESGQVVVAANFNAPLQVVIAGATPAVALAGTKCQEAGARRVIPLEVSAPFHSPLMAPARQGLEPTLQQLSFADPVPPLYRNVDARPVTTGAEIQTGLIRQVDSPVLWTATVKRLLDNGFDTFVEVGAGSVLSGLVRRLDRRATCYTAGTVESINKLIEALALGEAPTRTDEIGA